MPEITHEDLRKRAVQWLASTRKCSVVVSEIVTYAGEIPDAIGWRSSTGESTLIECKVSRADFLRNAAKPFVRDGTGVGQFRYFMAPEGMFTIADLGESGYGLLAVGAAVRVVRHSERFVNRNRDNEVLMLVSALRRVKTREFLTLNTCECSNPEVDHA